MGTTLRQRRVEESDRSVCGLNLESFRQVQDQAGPFFVSVASVLEKLSPLLNGVYDLLLTVWKTVQPYHPEDLFMAIYGFFLVFFGGVFMTLVASAEAAYQFGWHRIKEPILSLSSEWAKARIAFERDNKVRFHYFFFFEFLVFYSDFGLWQALTFL